jgi:uncharacterized protein YbjT (DUF2867 family)
MTKRILVAGATGQTGRQVVQELLDHGAEPVALVRDGSDTSVLPKGAKTRNGDLTELQEGVCDGVDAVVFAAGSGADTGEDMTKKVDRDGAKRLVDLANDAGCDRFVMLSSIGADNANPEGDLAHYLEAKHDADEHLKRADITHAIIRPVALTNDGRSEAIILGEGVDKSAKASRADVAAFLAEAAVTGVYDGQAVDMQSS